MDRYTTLAFLDSTAYDATALSAAPDSPVRINWILHGFGFELAPDQTTVEVDIDGAPVSDVAVDIGNVSTQSNVSTVTGAATFRAPTAPGKHSVRLTIRTSAQGGQEPPEPGFLTTVLDVA